MPLTVNRTHPSGLPRIDLLSGKLRKMIVT